MLCFIFTVLALAKLLMDFIHVWHEWAYDSKMLQKGKAQFLGELFCPATSYFTCATTKVTREQLSYEMGRVKRIWYLSHMRAAKVQASLRIRAVWPEPALLAHTSSESRGTFRQKARSLAPLNGWACAVKICHDGMLEDTNSLDAAQMRASLQY